MVTAVSRGFPQDYRTGTVRPGIPRSKGGPAAAAAGRRAISGPRHLNYPAVRSGDPATPDLDRDAAML
jgi:hypothetical protein